MFVQGTMGIRDCRRCGKPFKVVVVDGLTVEIVSEELKRRYNDLNLMERDLRNGIRVVNECPHCGCIHGDLHLRNELHDGRIRYQERFSFDADIRCMWCGAPLDPPPSSTERLCSACLKRNRHTDNEEIRLLVSQTACDALQDVLEMVEFEFRLFKADNISDETLREDITSLIEKKMSTIRWEYGWIDSAKEGATRPTDHVRRGPDTRFPDTSRPQRPSSTAKEEDPIPKTNVSKVENRDRPRMAGKKWTDDDDVRLRKMFKDDVNVADMMREFGRSRTAILCRLGRLGLIDYQFRTNQFRS